MNTNTSVKDEKNIGLANAPMSKKIGFFSAMMIVISSSIGAGIFFKAREVLEFSHGSVIFAIACWILSGFAIICMALAIVEICSASKDDLSVIGWCKKFNSKFVYKSCKNFMFYIFLPFVYFIMPYYVIKTFQDAVISVGGSGSFGVGDHDWIVALIIALGITVYFLCVSGLFTKVGNIQNWIIVSVKFIPLVLVAIIGFIIVGTKGYQGMGNGIDFIPEKKPLTSLAQVSPFFGLFLAMGAIFFAYDGFYVSSGLQSQMKEPKKTPIAILIGLIIVTVVYLAIAISMSIGTLQGDLPGFEDWLMKHTSVNGVNWLYATIQILIGVGTLGIINGFSMWYPRFNENLIKEREIPFSDKLINKINKKRPVVGVIYSLCVATVVLFVFTLIGALGFQNKNYSYPSYTMSNLYSFVDLMSTWTAVISFAYIVMAIIGCLKNRKTNTVKVTKTKYFVPTAIIAVIAVSLPLVFVFIQPIVDLFLLMNFDYTQSDLIGRITTVVVLIIFILISTVTVKIDYMIEYKKKQLYKTKSTELMAQINDLYILYKVTNDYNVMFKIEALQRKLNKHLNYWNKTLQ